MVELWYRYHVQENHSNCVFRLLRVDRQLSCELSWVFLFILGLFPQLYMPYEITCGRDGFTLPSLDEQHNELR
jgi:hypothetical protein